MTVVELEYLQQWVGRQESRQDQVSLTQTLKMHAALDMETAQPEDGDGLPALWHWIYFLPRVRASMLDSDGHAVRGGFLPPVPLPGRVWGGSRISFYSPVVIGDTASRTSSVKSVQKKGSDESPLVVVTVQHDISVGGRIAIREEQDIIYRGINKGSEASVRGSPAPPEAQWTRKVVPDSVLLFRFSALTFNAHRIHYDRDYATQSEGYPGLVVHGPLTAMLLVALLEAKIPGSRPVSISIRAERPLFDTARFSLNGRCDDDSATLWTLAPDNTVSMRVRVDCESRRRS